MKEYAVSALEILEDVESFRPVVQKGAEALKSFGPELAGVFDALIDYSVDTRARMVKRFVEEHGFSHEDAIFMTSDIMSTVARSMRDASKNQKST